MLDYLTIRGFALIDELNLPFADGLTVLTGETGAGKSIIVDALAAALGERVEAEVVRTGASTAILEARFTLPEGKSTEAGQASDLVVSREVRREGKGRVVVNGAAATLSRLRELAGGLVDLHGQHEHQSLLKAANHLGALDAFAGLEDERRSHAALFAERGRVRAAMRSAEEGERERAARKDYLRFVAGELDAAGLVEGEEESLRETERVLASAEKLQVAASQVLEALYDSDGSLAEGAARAASVIAPLAEVDRRLAEPLALLQGARSQVEECARLLRDYAGRVQTDPARLEEVAERLALLAGLKKKYGPTVSDLIARRDSARSELTQLEEEGMSPDELAAMDAELTARLEAAAAGLSRRRTAAAERFAGRVRAELVDLAMEKVRFKVDLEASDHTQDGTDHVEFLFSPNPGEPLLPLRKIASGGELSRVMLAVKRILAGADTVPTLVFDEVDAGIGGRTAAVLGRKLREIAGFHQVLCITHLPQVAACAHQHVRVEKTVAKGRTTVSARRLDREERVAELARMMGGLELTAGILRSAREMLESAHG